VVVQQLLSLKRLAAACVSTLALGSCVGEGIPTGLEVPMTVQVEDWRDEVIYQLLTDRFANGDPRNDWRVDPSGMARYHGGDYLGVVAKLDYLSELGVTTIWISPIVLNVDTDAGVDAYHGYWAVDLTRLNPHFGDLGALREMVRACHERGIKVVLDIVTNHLGQVFYYDINRNGQPDENVYGSGTVSPLSRVTEYDPDYDPRGIQSFTSLGESGPAPIVFFDMPEIFRTRPMPEIFQRPEAYNRRGRVTDYGIRDQVVYGDFPGGLKDLDTSNPDVREAMIRSYADWILKTDIDGFRIDTLKHVEHEFWRVFCAEVRMRLAARGKTNFFMFGEAFDGDDALLGSFTAPGELDSVFYFSHKFQVFGDVFVRGQGTKKIEELYAQRAVNYNATPQPGGVGVAPRDLLVNFLDNHDVPRFLYEFTSGGDARFEDGRRRLKAALAYLLTQDGIPCLYYGTEQDYSGGNDPANREDLAWSGFRTDGDTFRWVARLTALRRSYPALRRGNFNLRWTTDRVGSEQDAGIVAFDRALGEDYALVVVNSRDKESETSASSLGFGAMRVGAPPGTMLVDVLGDGAPVTVGASGEVTVRVGPFGAAVYVPAAQRR
jgi:glycosidase